MREPTYVEHIPLHYRAVSRLIRGRVRGSSFLHRRLMELGMCNYAVNFSLAPSTTVDVPLYTDNIWFEDWVVGYERRFLDSLAAIAERLPRPVELFDCGASFGLVSAHLAARLPFLTSIVAFEPNPAMHTLLSRNLSRLPIRTAALHRAVSDFRGHGELCRPENDASPDAAYLAADPTGPIEVVRLDDLEPTGAKSAIIKIDVEGGELAVLRGGQELLRRLEHFVVTLEAHRAVAARTGIDPIEYVRALRAIRPCAATVGEESDVKLDLGRPFFEQVGGGKVFNIIVSTLLEAEGGRKAE